MMTLTNEESLRAHVHELERQMAWRTGTPPDEGDYDVIVDHRHGEPYRLTDVWWSGEHWERDNVILTPEEVTHWMPIPALPETAT